MEEVEKGKTFRYLREKRGVSEAAKENLKNFTRIRKSMLDALKEGDMTVAQLSQKLAMPGHEVVYYLMTLVKYNLVQTGEVDDMDEYFSYKLKQ